MARDKMLATEKRVGKRSPDTPRTLPETGDWRLRWRQACLWNGHPASESHHESRKQGMFTWWPKTVDAS